MEQAIAWLSGLADRIPLDRPTLALVLVFASTVMIAATLAGAVGRRDPVGRRLAEGAPAAAAGGDASLRGYGAPPKLVQAFRPAAEKLVPKSTEKVGRIRQELIQAGYLAPSAVTVYFAVKLAAAAGLAMAALMLLPLVAPSLAWPKILLAALGQQPDEANTITRTLFVSLAMIESTAIYCFVVTMILIFANPFWDYVLQQAGGG